MEARSAGPEVSPNVLRGLPAPSFAPPTALNDGSPVLAALARVVDRDLAPDDAPATERAHAHDWGRLRRLLRPPRIAALPQTLALYLEIARDPAESIAGGIRAGTAELA
jgi:hypothetical protein